MPKIRVWCITLKSKTGIDGRYLYTVLQAREEVWISDILICIIIKKIFETCIEMLFERPLPH